MLNEYDKLLMWLVTNKDYLRLEAIERKISCPRMTLQKASTGERQLPRKYRDALYEFIVEFSNTPY